MTLHRGNSHAPFWLTLAAPPIAWAIARWHGEMQQFRRWCLAVWLALVTHPLLDVMTVYGTQIARPFTDHPYGVGSIFVIDPLYTLPLIAGVTVALRRRDARGLRWNQAGLLLSTVYLGWGFAAQQHVEAIAAVSLAEERIDAQRVLVTPTPFNTVLWRVVAMTPSGYHEGFYSLLDREPRIRFDRFDRGEQLYATLAGQAHVDRIARFSHGFFKMSQQGEQVLISDLRMGQEPNYTFSFVVATRRADALVPVAVPVAVGQRGDIGRALGWLCRRARGELVERPR